MNEWNNMLFLGRYSFIKFNLYNIYDVQQFTECKQTHKMCDTFEMFIFTLLNMEYSARR